MNCRRNRNVCGLVFGVACIAAANFYSIVGSYRSEIASTRRVLAERGQTVLDALRAGILAHGRLGRYRGDRLAIIFSELARSPDILALELRDPGGQVIASGGRVEALPSTSQGEPGWSGDRLVLASHVDLYEECVHGGEGRGGADDLEKWAPFTTGIHVLTAVLDGSAVQRDIRRHRVHFTFSLAVTFGSLGLGVFSVLLMLKRRSLAVELEKERERASRQEQIAHLGAGLAHETKNPLGIVRGLAQAVGECSQKECPSKAYAQQIVDEVDRVIGGVNSFLALSRPKEAAPVRLDLDAFFKRFMPVVQMDAAAVQAEVTYRPSGFHVLADESLLRRALLNLILNALRASKPGQAVLIDVQRSGTTLALRVSDAGCGIAPEDLPRVTEPYFTRFAGGSGLGLPIVEQIAASHGWRLRISSLVGQGTQVSLEGLASVEET